jgi:hypothetical protein
MKYSAIGLAGFLLIGTTAALAAPLPLCGLRRQCNAHAELHSRMAKRVD